VRLLATIAAVVSAGLLVVAGAAAALGKASFQLKGEVYPNSLFKIEMENKAGKKLKSVKAGTYRIKIEDRATIHNFRLKGPGFNKATSVRGRTEAIWIVKLRRGTYTFLCDPHAGTMRGKFRVT
jgi:plastocyanin